MIITEKPNAVQPAAALQRKIGVRDWRTNRKLKTVRLSDSEIAAIEAGSATGAFTFADLPMHAQHALRLCFTPAMFFDFDGSKAN